MTLSLTVSMLCASHAAVLVLQLTLSSSVTQSAHTCGDALRASA